MKAKRCNYQNQDAEMTLRQGIQEYYETNPHLLLPSNLDAEGVQFFHNHDRIHVVFGCDTSLPQEFRADFWTMFGTDVTIQGYLKYISSPAIKALAKDSKNRYSKGEFKIDVKAAIIPGLKAPLEVFLRTRKMKKKWPWIESAQYMDKSLKEIRNEFGIRVL